MPLRGKVRAAPASIKMLDFSSLHIASIILLVPHILRPATASLVRRPTGVFVAQISHRGRRRERDTGHGAFRLRESGVFRFSGGRTSRGTDSTGQGPRRQGPRGRGPRGAGFPGMKYWVCCSLAAACHPVTGAHFARKRRLRRPCVRCLALPGKVRCRCACSTLFALRGKSASELARRFWSVHGKEFFAGRFAHQETFPARRGTGNGAVVHFPAGGRCMPSHGRNAPFSR